MTTTQIGPVRLTKAQIAVRDAMEDEWIQTLIRQARDASDPEKYISSEAMAAYIAVRIKAQLRSCT